LDKQQQQQRLQQQQQQQPAPQLTSASNSTGSQDAASAAAAAAAPSGYEDVAEAAFGRLGRLLVSGLMYAELLGICCVYVVLEVRRRGAASSAQSRPVLMQL
jgi:predicted lipid-binding transport protein (Tim44 family)